MILYLVRHAEPKKESEDPTRPLSKKGWDEIEKLASFAHAHLDIHVKQILHSGKLRAQQTADVLAKHLNPVEGLKETDGLKPLDDSNIWAQRVNELDEDIMLVGHLPHLSNLVSNLLVRDEQKKLVEFTTAGTVCLARDDSGVWFIRWVIDPGLV